jgi:capsular exopolysaccharide synthesis family protein
MDNNTIKNGSIGLLLPQANELPQEGPLQIALRHRWTIVSITALLLVIAYIYILKATPIYTSTSRLYVEQSGPKIINEYEGVMTRSKNYLHTQSELMKSTPIIAEVVDDAQVKRFRTFERVDNLSAYVKKKLDVSIGRKDDIIAVAFDSPYPAEAAQIVNAMVDSYIRYHSTRKRSTVSEVLRILQKEKVKRDKELSDKFGQMLEFTRENSVVSFNTEDGNIIFERLNLLSSALTQAQLTALNAKADFEAVKGMVNEPAKIRQFAAASTGLSVSTSDSDRENQLRSELRRVENKLEDARYHCTEDHPSIQACHARINRIKEELNEQAKEFADAYTEVMELRWTAARQREDELRASFDEQHQAALGLGVKAAEYSVLQSELKRAERICEILDDRIKELNITEDVGALNISILEVAHPADRPSKPEKAKIMAMALALGIASGIGLALLRDWMDHRLRSADEISAVLGVPVLGVVPTMPEGQGTIVTKGQKMWLKLRAAFAGLSQTMRAAVTLPEPQAKAAPKREAILSRAAAYRAQRTDMARSGPKRKPKAVVVRAPTAGSEKITSEKLSIVARGQKVRLKPKSVIAEAYRTVRTAVFFGVPKDEAKTILVTSPAPGDGKSTLVSNLAIAMAQAGQRVLVLDADFRRPMQHNIFEVDSETGLPGVFAGAISLDEAIQPGPVEGFDILACGSEVPNPSEILNSHAFAETLKSLSERYDRVIIDSPPVGPVTDSQILAAICDVVLLVLRAGKSMRRRSQQARDTLLSVGAHLLGAVVNDVPQKRGRYGYYSGYGHYHRYGHYGYYGKEEKKTG